MAGVKWETDNNVADLDEIDGIVAEEVQTEEVKDVAETTLDDIDDVKVLETEDDFDKQFSDEETKEEDVKSEKVNVLKSTAEFLSDKYGVDLPEVEEWTEDTYIEYAESLLQHKLNERYNTAKDSNELVKALLDVTEAGGDVSDILALFEQKTELSEINTTTVDGKREMIRRYYIDIEGKTPEWTNRYIKKLELSDDTSEIETEFADVEKSYTDYFEQEKNASIKAVQEAKIKKENLLKKQIGDFGTTLEKVITKKEANDLIDFVYKEKYVVRGTDEKITEFDKSLAVAKNNPEELKEIALFLKDREGYIKKKIVESKNVSNEKKFDYIKNKKDEGITKTETITTSKTGFKI